MYCSALAESIGRHLPEDGQKATPVPGLVLYRRSQTLSRSPGIYRPSICVVAQGRKRMHYGNNSRSYDSDNYLISSLTLPAEAEIVEVSPERPFLALIVDINRLLVSRLIIALDACTPAGEKSGAPDICVSSPISERLRAVFERLVGLLDEAESTADR